MMDDLGKHFVAGIKPSDSYMEILNWYRNLYHTENMTTERGIMAWAINELLNEQFNTRKSTYMKFDCPECGAPLEVWSEEMLEAHPGSFDSFGYEKRSLIRHCSNCHCDWENEWETQFGDVGESQLRRKFWG